MGGRRVIAVMAIVVAATVAPTTVSATSCHLVWGSQTTSAASCSTSGDAPRASRPALSQRSPGWRPTARCHAPARLVDVRGFPALRQVAWAGSQEGLTAIGIGVRARPPFGVFVLAGPGSGSCVVIDVAHRS